MGKGREQTIHRYEVQMALKLCNSSQFHFSEFIPEMYMREENDICTESVTAVLFQ